MPGMGMGPGSTQDATTMATICTDAVDRPADSSWPGQVLLGLGVTAALVLVAYFVVDQPVMSSVSSLALGQRYGFVLKGLTRPPEVFVLLAPVVLLAGLLRRRFGPWG